MGVTSMTSVEIYESYANKIGDRITLFKTIQAAYNIETALYPGSHVDISPSLVIPKVTYVDNFKGAIKFFKDQEGIEDYIQRHKFYKSKTIIDFLGIDYYKLELSDKYDLIISQYAGFVGQATKRYLKKGGYLLCNDSHGDATLAYHDPDFDFLGIIKEDKVVTQNNKEYFKLKNDKEINIDEVKELMKGPVYLKNAQNYIFRLL